MTCTLVSELAACSHWLQSVKLAAFVVLNSVFILHLAVFLKQVATTED